MQGRLYTSFFEYIKIHFLSKKNNLPILSSSNLEHITLTNKYVFFVKNYVIAIPECSKFTHPAGNTCLRLHHLQECSYDYNFHSNKAKNMWNEFCVGLAYKKDLEKYIKQPYGRHY